MNEIICPSCKKAFKVDEAGFADILKQVRDEQFSKDLHERLETAEKEKENAIKLAESNLKNTLQEELAQNRSEVANLKSKLDKAELEKNLTVSEAVNSIKEKLKKRDSELMELKASKDRELAQTLAAKETEISEIKSKLDKVEVEKKLSVTEAVNKVEKERDTLANELKSKESEKELLKSSLKDKYENELKSKDEMIAYYKDMKLKLSTKMIGETLEQHCEIEFNKLRPTGFQNAYFEKDNDSRTGSKGDYIYREMDGAENEIISIMFEMKNEGDETATKKRNEDFLRELDKDRIEKKCEYAILVSLLESDNDLYNSGIVDVSHKYQKMYVIRPQFFIPIITLLKNAAVNSLKYKAELALMKNQTVDITNFEDDINKFKEGFAYNYDLASRKFKTAIDEIDKTIIHLQKTKNNLLSSENNLRLANNKAEELTIKKLTRNNPTMKSKFEEISDKTE